MSYAIRLELICELFADELASLIRIEDFQDAIPRHGEQYPVAAKQESADRVNKVSAFFPQITNQILFSPGRHHPIGLAGHFSEIFPFFAFLGLLNM